MKVWLFDIDGTLILSGGAGQAAAFAAIESDFGVPAVQDGIQFAGRTDRAITDDIFEQHNIENTETNRKVFLNSYLQHLEEFLRSRSGRVLAGVREVLDQLHARSDDHLGLLTGNIQAGARTKLRYFGLWDLFQFGGFGDEHASRDDVAGVALSNACEHLSHQVDPQDVIVVGDTVHDIRCAQSIGARAVAVATGGVSSSDLEAAQPDVLLDDLAPSDSLRQLLD